MKHDEIVIRILGRTTMEMPELNQHQLRSILQEVLYDYTIEATGTALATLDNMPQMIALFLASKQLDGLSPITLKNYKRTLARLSEMIKKNAEDFTTMDLRAYIAERLRSGAVKPQSLETDKTAIKSFFSWLTLEELIPKDPSAKLKAAKLPKVRRVSLDDEELEKLRDACITTRERAIVELFFSTGCRAAELSGIDLNHINWNQNSIKVIGKGNKERMVYFSGKAKLYLRKYLKERGILDNNGALFVASKAPHTRFKVRGIQLEIEHIKDRTSVTKPVHPHILRHTFATLGYKAGMRIDTIQELLGHSTPATTLIYVDADEENTRNEHRKHMSI